MSLAVAPEINMQSFTVNWVTKRSNDAATMFSATFMNDYGAVCRVLWDFQEVRLYPANPQETHTDCVMKYNMFSKTLTILESKKSFAFPFQSRHPFLMEVTLNNQKIKFTEPKSHVNNSMKYEAIVGQDKLSNHFRPSFKSKSIFEINVILLNSIKADQMTKKELKDFLFLMCVVTRATRRNSFFANFLCLVCFFTLTIGLVLFIVFFKLIFNL